MILPIYCFGFPVLREEAKEIPKDFEDLPKLVEDMFETMYAASGVGLAGPQVGKSLRIFTVDTIQSMEEGEEDQGIKKAFINPEITAESGKAYDYEEGCLSIPNIRGDVSRQPKIRVTYFDENWVKHDEIYDGLNARVIQHEYDHIDGILFLDHLKPIKKRLIKRKLEKLRKGLIEVDYKVKFNLR